jgi:flagellar L-ring protein precursor FlgH
MRHALAILPLLLAGGCTTMSSDVTRDPMLTPVGSGLTQARTNVPVSEFRAGGPRTPGSTWGAASQDLFRDIRAAKVGDVVTVTIQIDDKAELENESDRSRAAGANAQINGGFGLFGFGIDNTAAGVSGNYGTSSNSFANGKGTVDRSEKLKLSVAAVVTEVLPNGNLVISGSQEIKVNYEIRVLNIAGIVRPLDISRQNLVPYDKVAEARISYGGRGRVTDVQQPTFAHRVYDAVSPF